MLVTFTTGSGAGAVLPRTSELIYFNLLVPLYTLVAAGLFIVKELDCNSAFNTAF